MPCLTIGIWFYITLSLTLSNALNRTNCPPPEESKDFVVVVDSSESITDPDVHGEGAEKNFDTFKAFISHMFKKNNLLKDTDNVGLVEFASKVNVLYPPGKVPAREIDLDDLVHGAQGRRTNIAEALKVALKQLLDMPKKSISEKRRVVLFTDGRPNCVSYVDNCNPCHKSHKKEILKLKKKAGAHFAIYAILNDEFQHTDAEELSCLLEDDPEDVESFIRAIDDGFAFFGKEENMNKTGWACIGYRDEDGCCVTLSPTRSPTHLPTPEPSMPPTPEPSTSTPTLEPTYVPTTQEPTLEPTPVPTPAVVISTPEPSTLKPTKYQDKTTTDPPTSPPTKDNTPPVWIFIILILGICIVICLIYWVFITWGRDEEESCEEEACEGKKTSTARETFHWNRKAGCDEDVECGEEVEEVIYPSAGGVTKQSVMI